MSLVAPLISVIIRPRVVARVVAIVTASLLERGPSLQSGTIIPALALEPTAITLTSSSHVVPLLLLASVKVGPSLHLILRLLLLRTCLFSARPVLILPTSVLPRGIWLLLSLLKSRLLPLLRTRLFCAVSAPVLSAAVLPALIGLLLPLLKPRLLLPLLRLLPLLLSLHLSLFLSLRLLALLPRLFLSLSPSSIRRAPAVAVAAFPLSRSSNARAQ